MALGTLAAAMFGSVIVAGLVLAAWSVGAVAVDAVCAARRVVRRWRKRGARP
jgi:hypothetical protein